jgi:hypothetical protein
MSEPIIQAIDPNPSVLYERDEARWVLIRLIDKYQAAEAD